MCKVSVLNSLLEEICFLQIPAEQVFVNDKYKFLLQNFTWKQISKQIEKMDSTSRLCLRNLQSSFISEYVLQQFKNMLPSQKTLWHNENLETFFFALDLLNFPLIDLQDWKEVFDSAEYSLRLQFSYHGIDLSYLSKKINSGEASQKNIKILFFVLHRFLFEEIKILSLPTNFFKPCAHNLYQILTGTQDVIPFNLAIITLFLLLRLTVFTEIFYLEQKLILKTSSHSFYFRMDGRITLYDFPIHNQEILPMESNALINLKISEMQKLFFELKNSQMQNYLVNLQKIVVS